MCGPRTAFATGLAGAEQQGPAAATDEWEELVISRARYL